MQQNAQDIISLPIELNPKISDSRFRLVHIAAQRVRELAAGQQPLVSTKSIKDTTIALEESLLGSYHIITGEQAKKAKEEQQKRREQQEIEEQLSAKEEEIRRELSAYLTETQGETEAVSFEGENAAETEEAEEQNEDNADESEFSDE